MKLRLLEVVFTWLSTSAAGEAKLDGYQCSPHQRKGTNDRKSQVLNLICKPEMTKRIGPPAPYSSRCRALRASRPLRIAGELGGGFLWLGLGNQKAASCRIFPHQLNKGYGLHRATSQPAWSNISQSRAVLPASNFRVPTA